MHRKQNSGRLQGATPLPLKLHRLNTKDVVLIESQYREFNASDADVYM